MSETKHTPGPWELEVSREDGTLLFWITAPDGSGAGGNIILDDASIEGETDEEQIANARLIAAAPEMLAFAKKQRDETQCICRFKAAGYTDLDCIHCEAAALIAKAEGR
jgi:hypothetical protein